MLTNEQKEKLSVLIGSGHNTYEDLHKAFPNFTNRTWYLIIGDSFKQNLGQLGIDSRVLSDARLNSIFIYFCNCPNDYRDGYQFKDTDTFVLSVEGQNVLYQIRKDNRQLQLTLISIIFSAIAAITGIVTLLG